MPAAVWPASGPPVITDVDSGAVKRVADPVYRRRLIRTAIVLLAAAAVLGVFEAWLWSRIAPGVHYQVFANQTWAPLPTETQHVFVAFAMFVLLGLFTGIVLAVVGWTRRSIRGLGMLLLVGVAAALCTLIAGLLGQRWSSGVEPSMVAEIAGVQTIVEAPAEIRGAPPDRDATNAAELAAAQQGFTYNSAYLAAPAAAVITYTVLAAWNGLPNLGRRREERDAESATLVTSGDSAD